MNVRKNVPVPVEPTYDILGLTRNEIALISAFVAEFYSRQFVGDARGSLAAAERLHNKLSSSFLGACDYPFTDCFK